MDTPDSVRKLKSDKSIDLPVGMNAEEGGGKVGNVAAATGALFPLYVGPPSVDKLPKDFAAGDVLVGELKVKSDYPSTDVLILGISKSKEAEEAKDDADDDGEEKDVRRAGAVETLVIAKKKKLFPILEAAGLGSGWAQEFSGDLKFNREVIKALKDFSGGSSEAKEAALASASARIMAGVGHPLRIDI